MTHRFTDAERRTLPATFDRAAGDYDRTRPVCPAALFDDLLAVAGLAAGDRVLEIGPGTGQATVPLAERGLAVTAVEPGVAMAAIARRRLAGFPNARVVTSTFEAWEPEGGPFGAVVAVNCLHWIDPALRFRKAAEVLRDGGHLAVASTLWATAPDAERFWADVQEDYRAVGWEGGPAPPPDAVAPWRLPPEAEPFFEEVAARAYPALRRVYSAEEYLAQLGTQSGLAQLGEERSTEFLGRVRRRLADWPRLTATFVPVLTLGRRAPMSGSEMKTDLRRPCTPSRGPPPWLAHDSTALVGVRVRSGLLTLVLGRPGVPTLRLRVSRSALGKAGRCTPAPIVRRRWGACGRRDPAGWR